jgi:aerobic carbon-monoxide dehydrogenase medium subunit
MHDFEYLRASSLNQASAMLRENSEAKLMAGGQSLLASMRLGLSAPSHIIDLQSVEELTGIRIESDSLWIGAMSSHAAIANSKTVQTFCPMLSQLAKGIADQQIRQRGTIGGAIANADPAACWPAGLLAANAAIVTNQRRISADEFFQGLFATALNSDEIVRGILVPRVRRAAYMKFEQPASRFAIIGVAICEHTLTNTVRVAITGLGSGVTRYAQAEDRLCKSITQKSLTGLAFSPNLALGDLHASAEYRAHLTDLLLKRAITSLNELS